MIQEQQNILDLAKSDSEQNKELALLLARNYGRSFWKEIYCIVNTITLKADSIIIKNANGGNVRTVQGYVKLRKLHYERLLYHSLDKVGFGEKWITITMNKRDFVKTFNMNFAKYLALA